MNKRERNLWGIVWISEQTTVRQKTRSYLTADDTQHHPCNQNLNGPVLILIKILLSSSLWGYLPAGCDEK